MPTAIESRAEEVLVRMRERIGALAEGAPRVTYYTAADAPVPPIGDDRVMCAGNQHTCQPQFYVPALDRRFDMVLRGTGDSVIVGHEAGPRALVWQDTRLTGQHPELGNVSVSLQEAEVHAGTLLPLVAGAAFPALNRNTYFFLVTLGTIGELISDRPAIVEALIDEVPPTSTYVFRNGPLNFHLRSDPTKATVAVLEAAVTDVRPE